MLIMVVYEFCLLTRTISGFLVSIALSVTILQSQSIIVSLFPSSCLSLWSCQFLTSLKPLKHLQVLMCDRCHPVWPLINFTLSKLLTFTGKICYSFISITTHLTFSALLLFHYDKESFKIFSLTFFL